MKAAALIATLLAFGWTPAEARACTELFTPNDFLAGACKVAGSSITAADFAKVCAPSCHQGFASYVAALRASCGAAGNAEAARVQAGCAGPRVQPNIINANAQCLDYFSPNDFLHSSCRVSGNRIQAGDFAKVCSSSCSQDLKSYNLALRSTCGAEGDAEAKRIEAGCGSSVRANVAADVQCVDSFGPNDFLRAECQVQDGDLDEAAEFKKVCSGVCRQDLNGYLYALRSACAADGDAAARKIENECHSVAFNQFYSANSNSNSCIAYYNANDFLRPSCQVSDGKITSSADFAKVCSSECKQDLSGYLSALRATCANEGNFEASRIENGCAAGRGL
jgi:hypothetical protein